MNGCFDGGCWWIIILLVILFCCCGNNGSCGNRCENTCNNNPCTCC